ncbi:MAG: TetR/AcrR family transcriptional regulator [Lachnospiraceae bacterium]|nr:TetR/AcrR family transcriptional regulator [Lachnospiraceae bacterium]
MVEAVGKREQKKLLARNKIMEAAVSQFGSQGFQLTSVADIMRAADMGLGTFYNYFASKDELLHCLLDGLAVRLRQHLQRLEEKQESQAEILREMVMLTAELVGQNKYVLPLFLNAGEKSESTSEQREKLADKAHGPAFIAMFLHLVQAGQQSGEFRRDMSAEIITEMFHSLFQAAAFSSLPLSFEENIKMKLKLMIDGICVKA